MSINRNKVSISETIELETEIVLPEADTNRVVVLCHPHPLYGAAPTGREVDNAMLVRRPQGQGLFERFA